MASNALTTAGRFGSSQATEPADRGQRFPQIVVSAFRGPVHPCSDRTQRAHHDAALVLGHPFETQALACLLPMMTRVRPRA